jgi:transposase
MSKAKVIVLSVIEQGLLKAEVARRYGVSWRWVHTLIQRYERGGLDGLEPRACPVDARRHAAPGPPVRATPDRSRRGRGRSLSAVPAQWKLRHNEPSEVGLLDRASVPRHNPPQLDPAVVAQIESWRRQDKWTARQITVELTRRGHRVSAATVGRWLVRPGMVKLHWPRR